MRFDNFHEFYFSVILKKKILETHGQFPLIEETVHRTREPVPGGAIFFLVNFHVRLKANNPPGHTEQRGPRILFLFSSTPKLISFQRLELLIQTCIRYALTRIVQFRHSIPTTIVKRTLHFLSWIVHSKNVHTCFRRSTFL